ncbi:MAG: HAMP domain-containing histidine kinase [Lachnospiraceae bacterium]|nr:HAMP domain-containing histidine kinase [Lachnospiraceae bacterium]
MITDVNWIKRMLSHNMRMPMSVINGYGELMKQGLLTVEEMEEAVNNICENINYMNGILKVVLDEQSEEAEVPTAVDVAALVRSTAKYVRDIAKKMSVKIAVVTEQEKMLIKAEQIPMMRAFYHLFENAMKYSEGGDSIKVSIFHVENGQVLLVFKDNGKGMDEREVKNIFEEGFRGSNSKEKKGTGYGLYDVKNIVERYGGTVEISSREKGGFAVYMLFPAYKEEKGSDA